MPHEPNPALAGLQERFLEEVLPCIHTVARRRLRNLPIDMREELTQEAIGLAWQRYLAGWERGKEAPPWCLARGAVLDALRGVRVGRTHARADVCRARERGLVCVVSFERRGDEGQSFDPAGRPEVGVDLLHDLGAFLDRLSPRVRQLAELLAEGNRLGEAARTLGVDEKTGRNWRNRLREDWQQLHQPCG